MIVALISCSKEKRNYTCAAKELYSASTLFSLSYEYAKRVADKIYILSALYGLVPEDRVIQPYNKTLLEMPRSEQINWAKEVLSDLRQECDLSEDTFIFLAGKTYGQDILPAIKHVEQPLRGLRMGERISRLRSLIKSTPQKKSVVGLSVQPDVVADLCIRLHTLFNSLPRYTWETISSIPFSNGIYIVFENGETYHGMDRIVRVGTHTSDGRLINRLRDHFVKENHDGSIFRKNIGKAVLNAYHDPYLKIWTLDTSKPETAPLMDKEKNAETEARVSEFLRKNFSFTVFPVEEKEKRLRFEEGIISALHRAEDFVPSRKWPGQYSPEAEIRTSGLWLKQGLDAETLTEREFEEIVRCCGALGTDNERFHSNLKESNERVTENNNRLLLRKRDCSVKMQVVPYAGRTEVYLDTGSNHHCFRISNLQGDRFGDLLTALYHFYPAQDDPENREDFENLIEWRYGIVTDDNVWRVDRIVTDLEELDQPCSYQLIPWRAYFTWDEGNGHESRWTLEREPDEDIEFMLKIHIEHVRQEVEEYDYAVPYSEFCYAVAKACTETMKEYGFYGYHCSTLSQDINVRQLLFLKSVALGSFEARKLTDKGENGQHMASAFETEMELLLADM